MKSSSQYGQKILQKIRSFTAVLSTNEKEQFYSELSHYFKKGSWHSSIRPRAFRTGSTSYSTRAHQTRWQGLVNACTPDDKELLSHLFASMVDHSKSEKTLKVMDAALGKLNDSDVSVSVSSWISHRQVKQLQKAAKNNPAIKRVLNGVNNPKNLQVDRRRTMLKVQKVQKLESVLSAYQWSDFLRSYARYARNFEVERTSSMGVSHVSGSLSIGT